jgi:hypothetical protein
MIAVSELRGEARARAMVARAYSARDGLSRRFRRKRFARVFQLVDAAIAERGRCRIADLGGSRYYWDIAEAELAGRNVEITLVNSRERPAGGGVFRHLDADATDLSALADMSFDLAHSNSVIEHVGDWARMAALAANVRRLAPRYYVQTPYFWFPYEPHFRAPFIHWLPEQLRYRLVMAAPFGFAEAKRSVFDAMTRVQSARLLDRGQMRALFPDAAIAFERVCGLPKSLIAVRRQVASR